MNERNLSLDVFRTIGLLCIILAHVGAPNVLFQIRNFDVPFMVILSGFLYAMQELNKPKENSLEYLKKRFIRLVVPVWIFLIIFFSIHLISSELLNISYPFSLGEIISSFLLWKGIGYVWIIRIYLMVALVGPILINYLNKKNQKYKIVIVIYLSYEILIFIFKKIDMGSSLKELITGTIFYLIPYLVLFFYGTIISKLEKKIIKVIIFISFAILLFGKIYYQFVLEKRLELQLFKYPPSLFYTAYSVFVSSILFLNISKFERIKNRIIRKIISFYGSSTMWIYLWHISVIYFLQNNYNSINFKIKYVIVLLVASIFTLMQQKIFKMIFKKINVSDNKIKILKTILLS